MLIATRHRRISSCAGRLRYGPPHRRLAALATGDDAYRRGHAGAAAAAGTPLSRRRHRRHPQPSGRRTAFGHRVDANRVGNLRRPWKIPSARPSPPTADGVNVHQAAAALGLAPSTLHRHINDYLFQGEQITPGAPGAFASPWNSKARFLAIPGLSILG